MNWQDFYPGRRVVSLIDWTASPATRRYPVLADKPMPKKGEVVTVRDTQEFKGELMIELQEYANAVIDVFCFNCFDVHQKEFLFEAQFFRPLDESKLDQFRVHLKDAPADAPREAVPA